MGGGGDQSASANVEVADGHIPNPEPVSRTPGTAPKRHLT